MRKKKRLLVSSLTRKILLEDQDYVIKLQRISKCFWPAHMNLRRQKHVTHL